jgi:hypothetical protein
MHKPHESANHQPKRIARTEKDTAFQKTMQQARSHMHPLRRVFSRLIHSRIIDYPSSLVSNTIARPRAILWGSATSFFCTLFLYLVAKHYGYGLSGSEAILTFLFGWCVGNIIDYAMIARRKTQQ